MRKIVGSVILMVLILSGCSGGQTAEEEVTGLLNNYLEALKSNDTSELVKYSDDLRFPDKKIQKNEYSNIDDDIKSTKIVGINQVNDTEFEAMVEVVSDGESYELTLPVQKQKKAGKLLLDRTYKPNLNTSIGRIYFIKYSRKGPFSYIGV